METKRHVVVCVQEDGQDVAVFGPFDDAQQAAAWNERAEHFCVYDHYIRPLKGAELHSLGEDDIA